MTQPSPGPVVVIGLKEIYDQVLILSTRVELLIGQQKDAETEIGDHEQRLRALERARWPLPALAVAVSIVTFVVNVGWPR